MFRQNAYYPYRAMRDRPYMAEFLKLPDGERRWDTLTQMALFRTRASFGDREQTKGDTMATACSMAEATLCDQLASFLTGGHVVFHIAKPLREAFLASDLGDACGADLKFPFESFYVHLGADLGFLLNDGKTKLEGVLLDQHHDGTLRMALVGDLAEESPHWGLRGMESFGFFIDKENLHKPLLQAIEDRLTHEARDPNEIKELQDWSKFTVEEKQNIQESWASHDLERQLHLKNLRVTIDCRKLVANALLYLSQYPEDMEEGWQEGAPKGYMDKFERQDGKGREKTLSRARHEGFTLIRRVGKLFEREEVREQGDSPSPHLRRAHWRRQAFGPKLSMHKLVWIRAVRVLGGTQRERAYLMADEEPMASRI